MNHLMKVISLSILVILVLASSSWSKGTAQVTGGLHDLSETGYDPYWDQGSFYATQTDRVCVFCHTPHGGELNTPLWNKDLTGLVGAGVFTHYTNVLLSDYLQGLDNDRPMNVESLLCMSCHDGSLSVIAVHNAPNGAKGVPFGIGGDTYKEMGPYFEKAGARIGATDALPGDVGNLTDDHPISFSYDAVLADPIYASGARMGELREVAIAEAWASEGVRFFGADNRVECSSCHDPHVQYDYDLNTDYNPFLIMKNTGSSLCFACHNK